MHYLVISCVLMLASLFGKVTASFTVGARRRRRRNSSSLSMTTTYPPSPPRIAIIGSGAAGLAAARIISRQRGSAAADITVFEKDKNIAGVWNYKAGTSSTNPMYRGLRTNLPKEIMAFREFPWPVELDHSFVTHYEVADYLQQYMEHFDLERYIRYQCQVEQLTCLPGTRSAVSPISEDWPKIRLDWTQTAAAEKNNGSTNSDDSSLLQSETFDAVFVCNGHYHLPQIPDVPGLDSYFRGRMMHSIAYDDPADFAGQTVLCIGGRASGSDLAREIAQTGGSSSSTTKVYLSDTSFDADHPITLHNITWVPKTVEILPDGRVAFDKSSSSSSTIEPVAVDTIIFCSGYDYNFPFVNEKSNLELHAAQRRVKPLYEQLWHAMYPNVAMVGLPHSVVPFPLFELQAEAVERSWRGAESSSSSILPDLQERLRVANIAAESGGEGMPNGRVPEDTHYLGPMQWEYCRRLADYAGILDDTLEDYIATNKVHTYVVHLFAFCRWTSRVGVF